MRARTNGASDVPITPQTIPTPRASRKLRAALRPRLGEQLLHVWDHARWVFVNFCEFFAAPAPIAARDSIAVPECRAMES